MRFIKQLLTIIVFLLLSQSVLAEIKYNISIEQPTHHLANVEVMIPAGKANLQLHLPAWRTGKYQIINQANGIRNFDAKTNKGKKLDWQRADKSSWVIKNPEEQAVKVTYTVYANELGLRSRHIDYSHAYLDATAVLMYEKDLMHSVHQVELNVPDGWKSYSGMVQIADHGFIAQNYDQLADSPIETGFNELFEFSADGKDYQVVFWGKSNRANEKIAEDLKKLVVASQKVWTGYPYQKYVFIVHATNGATGATEHINSTVIQRPRQAFAQRATYLDRFLRTAAHEVVHTWNVKAYRPKGLVPYDYQAENYSDLLWKAEGSTSYLQDHLLLMADLQTPDEYLEELSARIDEYKRKPGRLTQSVSEASYEKWIAQSGDFGNNFGVSIYSEGFMASWLLDFQMLQDSNLKNGLRALHNQLYQQGQEKRTPNRFHVTDYDNASLLEEIKILTGKDYSDWWQKNIQSPTDIKFEPMLEQAGLQFVKLEEKDYKIWTGFDTHNKSGFIELKNVEKDSPAWKAKLAVGDQLIAVDGYKVTQDDLAKWLNQYSAGDTIKLTLFRNDKLINKRLTLDKINKKPRKIEWVDTPTESQKAFFKAWLGVDYPVEPAAK